MRNEPDLFSQPDYSGRDEALKKFTTYREAVVHSLRQRARLLWDLTREPISVNDLRDELARLEYDGDPRILGAVFMKSAGWRPVGHTMVKGSKAHAREVKTFAYVGAST